MVGGEGLPACGSSGTHNQPARAAAAAAACTCAAKAPCQRMDAVVSYWIGSVVKIIKPRVYRSKAKAPDIGSDTVPLAPKSKQSRGRGWLAGFIPQNGGLATPLCRVMLCDAMLDTCAS